ncbi:hypothetical protein KIN20_001187 [Parelaphostrongylus tenuis]|uniref:MD-2-related lipid-recognition domain-containing protein n=1 Tax=Parelaphostrongylus tenuis TaxID=148309 RepID=A0AAD5MLT7_PARTN|nr:hypothetical protein KIN20_001187 [Parelaphostrongylus tenuis]
MELTSEQIRLLMMHERLLGSNAMVTIERINLAWGEDTVGKNNREVFQMWNLVLFVQLSSFLLYVSASAADFQKIGYKDCKSKFKIVDVEALGCDLKDTSTGKKLCEFKDGTTPQIRIKFIPNENTSNLTTHIKAKIGETFLQFPEADSNACRYGVKCPLEEGKEAVYQKGIEIISNYPKNETVQVNWMLNKNDEKAVCIIFLARIVD